MGSHASYLWWNNNFKRTKIMSRKEKYEYRFAQFFWAKIIKPICYHFLVHYAAYLWKNYTLFLIETSWCKNFTSTYFCRSYFRANSYPCGANGNLTLPAELIPPSYIFRLNFLPLEVFFLLFSFDFGLVIMSVVYG